MVCRPYPKRLKVYPFSELITKVAHSLKDVRKFSNIDFFLQMLPLKDDELVRTEM